MNTMNQNYTLKNFKVDSLNELAFTASSAVAMQPISMYNPLYIYGKKGTGKTHLVQAIGNEIESKNFRVLYVLAKEWEKDYLKSVKTAPVEYIYERYNYFNVIIFDDVEYLEKKEEMLSEFLLFIKNLLKSGRKQIIITSEDNRILIDRIEEYMKANFSSGMIVDILSEE